MPVKRKYIVPIRIIVDADKATECVPEMEPLGADRTHKPKRKNAVRVSHLRGHLTRSEHLVP